jgi:hypothetical protein
LAEDDEMRIERKEEWKDVPGYYGLYQASTLGNVRRKNGRNSYMLIKPFLREKSKTPYMYRIRMSDIYGKRREFPLLSVIASAWCPPPPGMCVVHKNGMASDNTIDNIAFMKKGDILTKYAHRYTRKVVCKMDESGEVVEVYKSIADAAKNNRISANAVSKQCRKKVKEPIVTMGIVFKYDDT